MSFERRDMPRRLLLLGDVGEPVGLNRCVVGRGVYLATSDSGVCQAERRRGLGAISLDRSVRNTDVVHLRNQHGESADADLKCKHRNCGHRLDGDAGAQASAAVVVARDRFFSNCRVLRCVESRDTVSSRNHWRAHRHASNFAAGVARRSHRIFDRNLCIVVLAFSDDEPWLVYPRHVD